MSILPVLRTPYSIRHQDNASNSNQIFACLFFEQTIISPPSRGLAVRASSRINNVNRCLEMVGCVHISMLLLKTDTDPRFSVYYSRRVILKQMKHSVFRGGDPSCDEFEVAKHEHPPYIHGTDYTLLNTADKCCSENIASPGRL